MDANQPRKVVETPVLLYTDMWQLKTLVLSVDQIKKIHCWENTYIIQKVKSSAVQQRHEVKRLCQGPKCCFWLLTGSFHRRWKGRSHPMSPSSSSTCKESRKKYEVLLLLQWKRTAQIWSYFINYHYSARTN